MKGNEKRIHSVWPIPNNRCYNPILTLLPVPSLHPSPTSAKYTALSIIGQLRKTPWKVWSSIKSWGWPSITMGQEKITGLCWEKWALRKSQHHNTFFERMKLYTSFPEFLSWIFHFPDVWSKAYDLTTLCLNFLTWKVGIILVLPSLNFHEY